MGVRGFRSIVAIAAVILTMPLANAQSLRFFGSGSDDPDRDRVKIKIDAPPVPADIGGTDFTIEMWLRGRAVDNQSSNPVCNAADYTAWTTGNIFFDRDKHTSSPGFGVALKNGRVTFAVNGRVNNTSIPFTICSSASILNDQWHHVALTRRMTGELRIFIDGVLDGSGTGPGGSLAYPDNAVPENRCGPAGNQPCSNSDPYIVLGAEKHDAGPQYQAYSGYMDELRLSTTIRYTANFTRPTAPFTLDGETAALYHFDENTGTVLGDVRGLSNGEVRFNAAQTRPQWTNETPFAPSAGSIQMQSSTATVTETAGGTTVTLNVTRTGTVGAASVDYATSDVTAFAGSDYTTRMGTLNWANGASGSQPISVPILDDATFEGSETFAVTLSNAIGATLANPMATTVTINDNDSPPQAGTLQFSAATYSAPEAAGTATITVTRAGGSDGAVSVSYAATGGTATSGTDFTLPAGTLSWSSGDAAAKTFTLAINSDGAIEPNETVQLTLSGPTNGAIIGAIGSAILTLVDDDSNLQFSSATYSTSEAGPNAVLTVTRTGSSSTSASVSYATANGTATSPGDFTATTGVLTWNAGDGASKSISVPIANDTSFEVSETFTVALGSANGANLVAPSTATVTIVDNDTPVPGALQFDVPAYFADEADGTVTVSVTRSGGADGAVSVQYASGGGSATAGADYTAVSGTLTWANGDSAPKTFDLAIANDTSVEAAETINLTLSAPGGGATIGTTSASVVNIQDDDSSLQFSPAAYTVAESPGAAVVLTVTRTGSALNAASVGFQTAVGTADGGDFSAASGTLLWAAGDGEPKTISVTITDDATDEGAETFTVQLSGATGANLGAADVANVTIDPSDQPVPGTLRFSAPSYSVTEDVGTALISIMRSGGSSGAVSVRVATSNGTATEPSDYTATSEVVTFPDGVTTTQTVNVPIVNDTTQESLETINLALTNETGGAGIGTPGTAVINIAASDPSPGSIRFEPATYTASEGGGTVTLTVRRVGGSSGTASVQFQTANGTASAGSDYVARTGTLNWAAGNSNDRFIAITLTNDTAFEGNEAFTVNLSNPMGAALGTPSTSTVTIADNDVAQPGTLQFVAATPTVSESGGSVTLSMQRIGGTDGAVSATFATSGGSATSPGDYTAVTQTVTWNDGDSAQKTVSVPIINDTTSEQTETFSAAISAPTGGATLGTPTSLTITVNDDDPPPAPPPQEGSGSGGGSLGYSGLLLGVLIAWRRRVNLRGACASPR